MNSLEPSPLVGGRSGMVKSASGLGRQALVFDDNEVVRLLRAAVKREEGGQRAFARRHGLDRGYINKVLHGRARVRDALANALGLQRVYAAK